MSPTKKKSKKVVVKTESNSANEESIKLPKNKSTKGVRKESAKSPAKTTVVSSQLQKSMKNKEKQRQIQNRGKPNRGVLYIKHLPHGFFEEQLQKYFGQFGKVTRVRLARSLRTGRSRGYAFVEFAVPEVAEVAAETMNNYLMFRKIVKTAYIPPDQVKYNYFKTSLRKLTKKDGKEVFVSAKTKEVNKKLKELNNWSDENYKKRMKRTRAKLRKLKQSLGEDGAFVDSCVYDPEASVQPKEEKPDPVGVGPVAKKRKTKSTSEESVASNMRSSEVDSSATGKALSSVSSKSAKTKQKQMGGEHVAKTSAAETTLGKLLDSTIEDNGSSDDDFIPGDNYDSSDNIPGDVFDSSDDIPGDIYDSTDETASDSQDSEADDSEEPAVSSHKRKQKPEVAQKRSHRQLVQAMDDTFEDQSTSDDESESENESTSISKDSTEEEEEISPVKPVKKGQRKPDKITQKRHSEKNGQHKQERIIQKKPLDGGIRKRSYDTKPAKSPAIQQKIKETAKEIAKQKNVAHLNLIKQEKVSQMKAKGIKKKGKKRVV